MTKFFVVLVVAFGFSWGAYAQEPLNVVSTVGMLNDVVKNVGGDCVEATAIMGAGIDPHTYQASAKDVRLFQDADVIFYSGYVLEGQLGNVLERFAEQKPTVAASPSSIDAGDLITVQSVYGIDPHLWMDVNLWAKLAPTVLNTLSELRPGCAEQMQANVESFTAQLRALDGWVEESIASIPEQQRILVTAHDAFNYYGRAYGIDVEGIQGISTEAEAAIADIRGTVDTVVERQVPAIFVETTINPRTVESVIQAARQRGQEVEIGGQLYSDAMGQDGTAGGTYIGMLFENTRNITQSLGGTVPPLPEALSGWAEEWGVEMAQTE